MLQKRVPMLRIFLTLLPLFATIIVCLLRCPHFCTGPKRFPVFFVFVLPLLSTWFVVFVMTLDTTVGATARTRAICPFLRLRGIPYKYDT